MKLQSAIYSAPTVIDCVNMRGGGVADFMDVKHYGSDMWFTYYLALANHDYCRCIRYEGEPEQYELCFLCGKPQKKVEWPS